CGHQFAISQPMEMCAARVSQGEADPSERVIGSPKIKKETPTPNVTTSAMFSRMNSGSCTALGAATLGLGGQKNLPSGALGLATKATAASTRVNVMTLAQGSG